MNVKIGLSVQNTDGMKFDFGGKDLSDNEFACMLNDYMDTHSGINNINVENNNVVASNNDKFITIELDGVLLDTDKSDTLSKEYLEEMVFDEKMFLLVLNLRPCDSMLDSDDFDEDKFSQLQDAESEIRYWIKDSMLVWNSVKLKDEEKLLNSPEKDLFLTLNSGEKYKLHNCKVFEEYSTRNNPLYFAVIVEKIIKL